MHVRGGRRLAWAVACAGALGATAVVTRADAQMMAATTPLSPDTAREASVPRLGTTAFPPLVVRNANTGAEALVRLYDASNAVDEAGVAAFCQVAGDGDKPAPLKPRAVQLVFKAAYELGASKIILVSTYRPKDRRGRGGYHTTGEAVDFQLPGIAARTVAAHVRKFSRAGVGIYTHPKTQFVHVDAREQSFHWLDSSPPGRTWKEAQLRDPDRETRDASWTPDADRPREVAPPPKPAPPPAKAAPVKAAAAVARH